jgi:hypothetical protein
MTKFITRWLGVLFGAVLLAAGASPALAQFIPPPNDVGTTFEGCRNDGNPVIPPNTLVCPDAAYTNGNLGKGWNELDLVPFRLTTTATSAATYNIYIAADYRQGTLGYDVITAPAVNSAKSTGSCSVTPVGPQATVTGITGGTDVTVYRLLTISQSAGSSCVFDWVNRLAIGAAAFSGSNLQAYIFDQADLGGGKRTIPIPVKNSIQPQELSKTMAASRDADRQWNVIKSATPGNLDFGDVCKATPTLEKGVEVTVTWTKLGTLPNGDVTVVTNINAKNPSDRTITINVTDTVYTGQDATGTQLATKNSGDINLTANFNGTAQTFTYTIPAASAGSIGDYLNDKAVATYKDPVIGDTIGTLTALAKTQIQRGTTLNETANIADKENITGLGLQFKVATPNPAPLGSGFVNYTAGNLATEVNWQVPGLNADGSVIFVKKVVLDQRRITTGELADVATLVSTDSQFTTGYSLAPVTISSSATVSLTVHKTIPVKLLAGQSIVVNFNVTPTAGGAAMPVTVTFTGPSAIGAAADSAPLTGLAPASYTVSEGTSTFYATPTSTGVPLILVPDKASKDIDLSPKTGGIMDSSNCSGTVSFVNSIPGPNLPTAKVAKITLPTLLATDLDYAWKFTLSSPNGFVSEVVTANAGAAAVPFTQSLSIPGTYTVTETTKTGWDLTKVILPDATTSTTKVCTFEVTLTVADLGKVFECTFTNTKRGLVNVIKTLKGGALTTEQFTFQLRTGASSNADGTIVEEKTTNSGGNLGTLNFTTLLLPNTTYQLCESTQAGWMTTFNDPTNPLFVPSAFMPPGTTIPNVGVDNSWLCINFSVSPGETKAFNVDNSPPPGGRALTIGYWKTHASCTSSSTKKETALDRQLLASGGILRQSKIVSLVNGLFGLYGQTATATVDCAHAVSLLDKRDFTTANTKKASDPLFNMAAQLVAVEVNLAAGAYTCGAVSNAVTTAEGLLGKYKFTGFGYTGTVSKADATLANTTATKLDDYNNNRAGVCP